MVEIREIHRSDSVQLQNAASLVRNHSWGHEYPSEPMDEIVHSEFHVGAFAHNDLVGYSGINRCASPDGVDNGELWFVHAVVQPSHRRENIWRTMYQKRIEYVRQIPNRVLCCTDNPNVKNFLQSQGWKEIRLARDSNDGSMIAVLELVNRS